MGRLDEMVEVVFPLVAYAARTAVRAKLVSRGVEIVSAGRDLGEIVTDMDLDASRVLLDDGERRFRGLRSIYAGSFSEEQDSPMRREARALYEVDPCDGTGDAVATKDNDSDEVMSPTVLVTFLERGSVSSLFRPVVGLIYHVLGEFAVIGGEGRVLVGKADHDGRFVEVAHRVNMGITWHDFRPLRIGCRTAYQQHVAHKSFLPFLEEQCESNYPLWPWCSVLVVPVGGAGLQALQLLRSVISLDDPDDIPAWTKLEQIDIIWNTQPDWKTWDTDPIEAIAAALGFPLRPTSVDGRLVWDTNASNATLSDMHHKSGWVLAANPRVQQCVLITAADWGDGGEHLLGDLLKKDY